MSCSCRQTTLQLKLAVKSGSIDQIGGWQLNVPGGIKAVNKVASTGNTDQLSKSALHASAK